MTGHVHRNAAADRREPRCETFLLGDVHHVFGDVVARLGQCLDAAVVGQNQRPFRFEHQRAGRHERNHIIAPGNPDPEFGRDVARAVGNLGDLALFEQRHAAAAGIDDLGFHTVQSQHRARGHADCGVVVVAVAGRVDHRLAAKTGRIPVDLERRAGGAHFKGLALEFRQGGIGVQPGELREQRAGQGIGRIRRPVGDGGCEGGELRIAVHLCEFGVSRGDFPLRRLDGAVAQHQMREVKIETMGRHIGTFCHIAHVTQRAGIDDGPKIGALDCIKFFRGGSINQIEQFGE